MKTEPFLSTCACISKNLEPSIIGSIESSSLDSGQMAFKITLSLSETVSLILDSNSWISSGMSRERGYSDCEGRQDWTAN